MLDRVTQKRIFGSGLMIYQGGCLAATAVSWQEVPVSCCNVGPRSISNSLVRLSRSVSIRRKSTGRSVVWDQSLFNLIQLKRRLINIWKHFLMWLAIASNISRLCLLCVEAIRRGQHPRENVQSCWYDDNPYALSTMIKLVHNHNKVLEKFNRSGWKNKEKNMSTYSRTCNKRIFKKKENNEQK